MGYSYVGDRSVLLTLGWWQLYDVCNRTIMLVSFFVTFETFSMCKIGLQHVNVVTDI